MTDRAQLRGIAGTAARAAGAELIRRAGRIEGLATKSSDTDPVTDADRASETILCTSLLQARPDDGILGEEGASRDGSSGLRWVVDPLDGTMNYLYGLPAWTVSVAVDDAEGTLAGVVYQPVGDHLYEAARGLGSTCDGAPIRVNDPVGVSRALLATGFSYQPQRRRKQAELIASLIDTVRDIRRIGSAALDLCMVAAGTVDAYLEEDANHWDWAAGALLVTEAGGVVSDVRPTGGRSGILAAGPALHAGLTAVLPR